ncbi:ankyrin repeat-containing domain protein [Nemania sp. FL0031]|nr:ankyrin repeat-containing domain protein [Nemania sp. FL0031]
MTSLKIAAHFKSEALTRCLLEDGRDPNVVGAECDSALFVAAASGSRSIVELLLNHGARIELVVHPLGLTALHAALMHDGPGSAEILELMLQRGGNCNYRDRDGSPLLHHAISLNNVEGARLLLTRGADPNMVDASRFSSLHAAAMHGNETVASMLVNAGCEIERRDNSGMTPLVTALVSENASIAKLLLEHGANSSVADEFLIMDDEVVCIRQSKELLPPELAGFSKLSRLLGAPHKGDIFAAGSPRTRFSSRYYKLKIKTYV